MSSSSSRRRKRAEPKHQPAAPAPIDVDVVPHQTQQQPGGGHTTYPSGLVSHLLIDVCREAAIAADAARIPDPPLTFVSPAEVAATVAARYNWHAQLSQNFLSRQIQRVSHYWQSVQRALSELFGNTFPLSTVKTSLPTAVFEALVTQVATEGLGVLAAAWDRAVADETARAAAATARHQQMARTAGQWNRKSRPVGLLGSPGLGYGVNVLPYLRRSVEGRALHATSQEIGRACRLVSTRWIEVLQLYACQWQEGGGRRRVMVPVQWHQVLLVKMCDVAAASDLV
jgi:hypothetical protein